MHGNVCQRQTDKCLPIAIGAAKEPSACKGFVNHIQAMKEIKYAIETYNTLRPHCSCEKLTPLQAHEFGSYKHKKGELKKGMKLKS